MRMNLLLSLFFAHFSLFSFSAEKQQTMRIALAGVFEEVNTFAVEVMGYAQVTGNMTTGFECWADEGTLQVLRAA